jgi:hypothetical protein
VESDKEIARKRKRRTSYIANVLVVNDPKNPENEGKVFLFKFGQKIFDKIVDKLDPPRDEKGNLIDPDDVPMNPFDPVEGCNFKLKIRKVEGFANFDKSEFDKASVVDNIDDIMDVTHDLNQFIDPANFKSYEELEAKFNKIMGIVEDKPVVRPVAEQKPAPAKAEKAQSKVVESTNSQNAEDEGDSDLDYFKKLAEMSDD